MKASLYELNVTYPFFFKLPVNKTEFIKNKVRESEFLASRGFPVNTRKSLSIHGVNGGRELSH